MIKGENWTETPPVFKKRNGIGRRGASLSTATLMLLEFLNGDAPYFMLTCDSKEEAKRATNTAEQYAREHKLGVRVSRADNYVLFIRTTDEGVE